MPAAARTDEAVRSRARPLLRLSRLLQLQETRRRKADRGRRGARHGADVAMDRRRGRNDIQLLTVGRLKARHTAGPQPASTAIGIAGAYSRDATAALWKGCEP